MRASAGARATVWVGLNGGAQFLNQLDPKFGHLRQAPKGTSSLARWENTGKRECSVKLDMPVNSYSCFRGTIIGYNSLVPHEVGDCFTSV